MTRHKQEFIEAIWKKGTKVRSHNKDVWRKDQCKAWIKKSEYGNRNSQFGWEIDRISAGGKYIESNCRPLQWKNNLDKSDGRLKCNIKSGQYKGKHYNQ